MMELKESQRLLQMHEDDYGICQILPVENISFCRQELHQIGEFADEHRVEGGYGYTDMYRRQVEPIDLLAKQIHKELLDEKFSSKFLRFDDFANSLILDYDIGDRLWSAFGRTNQVVVIYTASSETKMVENIILLLYPETAEDVMDIRRIFDVFSQIDDFLFVNWESGWAFALNDQEGKEEYLSDLVVGGEE